MRRAARVDANHGQIVAALRRMGASVEDASRMGRGCPDLLVGFRGRTLLVEVKDGSKPPSDRRLTPDQVRWHERWRGHVAVVSSVDEAVALLNQHI
jgi:hypothetical protein